MPRPPCSLGEQTTGQATRHWPPVTKSVPVHRKVRLLSISSIAHDDKLQKMETWTGIADSVVFISVTLPAAVSSPAFQVGKRAATVSTSASSCALFRRDRVKRSP
jgi:hypothetical protein